MTPPQQPPLTGWRSGFPPCPKCGKKGLKYAPHPHAFGYKDYDHAVCRYCHARFVVRDADEPGRAVNNNEVAE